MLRRIFSIFVKEQPKFLGRWNLEQCMSKRNSKIDFANEDHCGVCADNSVIRSLSDNNQQLNSQVADTKIKPINYSKRH